jgi:outer membrane lipoprotein SlyB
MKKSLSLLTTSLLGLMLNACATPTTQVGEMDIRSGVIEQIIPTKIESSNHQGVGAILGGIGGAAIGSLMGQGTGKDLMMVAGAIGGAYLGNAEQDKYDQPKPGQQILVRITNGVLVSITQPVNPNLTPKMKVFVEGAGTDARVVPQY